jgi:hypothetical protein
LLSYFSFLLFPSGPCPVSYADPRAIAGFAAAAAAAAIDDLAKNAIATSAADVAPLHDLLTCMQ